MRLVQRFRIPALTAALGSLLLVQPSAAADRLTFTLPLFEEQFSLDLTRAYTAQELIDSNPDLQELDRAGSGAVQRLMEALLTAPLPQTTGDIVNQSLGHPLFEQALIAASELVQVTGIPVDTSGRMLADALAAAYRDDEPHLLGLLRHVPGEEITLNLEVLAFYANRLRRNQDDARALVQQTTAATPVSAEVMAGLDSGWSRDQRSVAVAHRVRPLEVTVIAPKRSSNGRLVVISHGLWDEPVSYTHLTLPTISDV